MKKELRKRGEHFPFFILIHRLCFWLFTDFCFFYTWNARHENIKFVLRRKVKFVFNAADENKKEMKEMDLTKILKETWWILSRGCCDQTLNMDHSAENEKFTLLLISIHDVSLSVNNKLLWCWLHMNWRYFGVFVKKHLLWLML